MNYLKNGIIFVLSLSLVFVSIIAFQEYKENQRYGRLIIGDQVVSAKNEVYSEHLENYYDIEYHSEEDSATLTINNPCIYFTKSTGISMQPFLTNESLSINDRCYPKENLKIGDIITAHIDHTNINIQHRIIDINYDEKWVKTKGDNPQTNPNPDDLISFDFIISKNIGFINAFEDKKIVKEQKDNTTTFFINNTGKIIISPTINETCVCSSKGILKLCHNNKDYLLEDRFVIKTELKEEYCKTEVKQ